LLPPGGPRRPRPTGLGPAVCAAAHSDSDAEPAPTSAGRPRLRSPEPGRRLWGPRPGHGRCVPGPAGRRDRRLLEPGRPQLPACHRGFAGRRLLGAGFRHLPPYAAPRREHDRQRAGFPLGVAAGVAGIRFGLRAAQLPARHPLQQRAHHARDRPDGRRRERAPVRGAHQRRVRRGGAQHGFEAGSGRSPRRQRQPLVQRLHPATRAAAHAAAHGPGRRLQHLGLERQRRPDRAPHPRHQPGRGRQDQHRPVRAPDALASSSSPTNPKW
jgi:hypothetical protein